MPAIFDARDDLLPHVATFRVTHSVVEPGLRDDISFIHVYTVPRHARLDPQNLERCITNRPRPGILQSLPQSKRLIYVNNKIKTCFTRVRCTDYNQGVCNIIRTACVLVVQWPGYLD